MRCGADGARVGEAQARRETFAQGCGIERGEQEPAILAADQRKRPVITGKVWLAAPLPLQPLDRQSGGARRKPYATSRNSTVQLRAGAMPRQRSSVRCQAGAPGAGHRRRLPARSLRRDTPAGERAGEARVADARRGAGRACGSACAARPRRRAMSGAFTSIWPRAAMKAPAFSPSSSAQAASSMPFRASTMRTSAGSRPKAMKPRAIRRAPFARGPFGQAPEERRGILPPRSGDRR